MHANGARGDLALRDLSGATLTVSSDETSPGHRPLRGAVDEVNPGSATVLVHARGQDRE